MSFVRLLAVLQTSIYCAYAFASQKRVVVNVAPTLLPTTTYPLQRSSVVTDFQSSSSPFRQQLGVSISSPKKVSSSSYIALHSSATEDEDELFDVKTTFSLVGAQALLVAVAAAIAAAVGTPNFGLGPDIDFGIESLKEGFLMTLPLGVMAFALDLVEDEFPALQDVTTATQRSILALLGGTWKPLIGLATATALGIAAGLGEEMLFRGVLQYEIGTRAGDALSLGVASIIFGALHAVTPLYAILASIASVYFGWLYISFDNLAVPISAHAIYDVGALLYAHWTVSQMTDVEQQSLMEWQPPGPAGGGAGQ